MSADTTGLSVLEWSPDSVSLFDPESQATLRGRTVADVAGKVRGKVIVAVSRRASFMRLARLPDVPKPEMAKILGLQLGKILPVEPNEVAHDFVILDDRNSEGRQVLVAAVRTDTLKSILSELESHGVAVDRVIPAALASIELCKSLGMSRAAVVGEDNGAFTIDIVDDGGLKASRTVPQADSLQAEISRTFGSASVPAGQVVTYVGVHVPGAVESGQDPLALLSRSTMDFHIELPETKFKRSAKLVQQRRGLAMLFWVAALAIGAVVFDIRSEASDKVAEVEKTWNRKLTEEKTVKSTAETTAKQRRTQKDNLTIAFEPKQPLGDVVTILTTLAPSQLWLTGLSAERGKPLTLRGTALNSKSVTNYLAALSKQSRMRDVTLVFANNGLVETTPVVNFSISAHVVGNLPLADEKGVKVAKS